MFLFFCVISIVNLWKRYGQKLHRIVLLQFELITFRFGHGRILTPLISMISGFWEGVLSSQDNLSYLLRHQDTSDKTRKKTNHSLKIFFCKYHRIGSRQFGEGCWSTNWKLPFRIGGSKTKWGSKISKKQQNVWSLLRS